MSDILTKVRQAAAMAPKPVDRAEDKYRRTDMTYSADAKKARQLVREMRAHSLPLLAQHLAKITGEMSAKIKLQETFDAFCVANDRYMREELKDPNRLIEWMGGFNGVMPALPDKSPEHKSGLLSAWNALLTAVNDATKVGVQKRHREQPITLVADLEDTSLILSETKWDD
jgi:hypothetical protein